MKRLLALLTLIASFSWNISAFAQQVMAASYDQDEDQQEGYAFLGIQSNNISEDKARLLGFDNAFGSYVARVIKGTAADHAGVQPFDYIFGVDEYRTGENQSLSQIMRKFSPGDKATLHLIRKGQKKALPVSLGRRGDSESEPVDRCQEPFFGIRHDHRSDPERGVGVTVVENSTAKAAGLQDGDIIVSVNDYPIIDWEDITAAIDNMKVGENIAVGYLRDGRKNSGSAAIKSYCDTRPAPQAWGVQPGETVIPRAGRTPGAPLQPRINPASVSISLENPTAAEADEIRNKSGADLTPRGDLRIEQLRLSPSGNRFRLEFRLPQSGDTSVRIYNASGRQIYNYDLGAFSGDFRDEVDLGQNGAGSYYLLVKQGDKSVGKKIMLAGK